MSGLAQSGGGWAGQLLAASTTSGFVFNFGGGISSDLLSEFESWGPEPSVQPRLGVFQAPLLQSVGDYDFVDERARSRASIYNEFLKGADASFCCMSHIDQIDDLAVVAVALRTERAGHVDTPDKASFAALTPHVRDAVRLQLRLEDEAARVAAGLMGAVSLAAFVCDRAGRVVALSGPAEQVLRERDILGVTRGVLRSREASGDAALAHAVALASLRAIETTAPRSSRVHLFSRAERRYVAADIAPLPEAVNGFRCGPSAIVVLKLDASRERPGPTLARLYALSLAEAEVALAIARGEDLAAIAQARGVKLSTLRTQVSAVLAKTDTRRQAELAALVGRLFPMA